MSKSGLRALLAVTVAMAVAPLSAEAMVCSITEVVGISFGTYNVFSSTPKDSSGHVTYQCDSGPADLVTIDISTGSSSTYTARTLRKGASSLEYNLYAGATRTGSPWGNGASGTTHYGPVLVEIGVPATVDIYGRIPAQQNVEAGNYSDTVVVTLNF